MLKPWRSHCPLQGFHPLACPLVHFPLNTVLHYLSILSAPLTAALFILHMAALTIIACLYSRCLILCVIAQRPAANAQWLPYPCRPHFQPARFVGCQLTAHPLHVVARCRQCIAILPLYAMKTTRHSSAGKNNAFVELFKPPVSSPATSSNFTLKM